MNSSARCRSPFRFVLSARRFGSPFRFVVSVRRFGSPFRFAVSVRRFGSPFRFAVSVRRFGSPFRFAVRSTSYLGFSDPPVLNAAPRCIDVAECCAHRRSRTVALHSTSRRRTRPLRRRQHPSIHRPLSERGDGRPRRSPTSRRARSRGSTCASWPSGAKRSSRASRSRASSTPALKARIEAAETKQALEDLYLPFKPKRRTRAMIARERGLEPLAELLWDRLDDARLHRSTRR